MSLPISFLHSWEHNRSWLIVSLYVINKFYWVLKMLGKCECHICHVTLFNPERIIFLWLTANLQRLNNFLKLLQRQKEMGRLYGLQPECIFITGGRGGSKQWEAFFFFLTKKKGRVYSPPRYVSLALPFCWEGKLGKLKEKPNLMLRTYYMQREGDLEKGVSPRIEFVGSTH